jgi:hypothetical protein
MNTQQAAYIFLPRHTAVPNSLKYTYDKDEQETTGDLRTIMLGNTREFTVESAVPTPSKNITVKFLAQ